ncbi:hypothetical protein [Virgibacillus sp. DJP39]|uniref:hypothetical protein n=1 Tax=Virgibacillus sp. DJP39 TaxID=3409790 RepID=UPI003BB71FA8
MKKIVGLYSGKDKVVLDYDYMKVEVSKGLNGVEIKDFFYKRIEIEKEMIGMYVFSEGNSNEESFFEESYESQLKCMNKKNNFKELEKHKLMEIVMFVNLINTYDELDEKDRFQKYKTLLFELEKENLIAS